MTTADMVVMADNPEIAGLRAWDARWIRLGQRPAIARLAGLPGSSKTSISALYEAPAAPDMTLRTEGLTVAASAASLGEALLRMSAGRS